MNAKSNRNILYAIIAAVVVAAVTAVVLFVSQCGGDDEESGTEAVVGVARRLMTPVAIDQGKSNAAKDALVASIARQGTGRVLVHVATNISPNASAQDQARAIASAQDNVLATVSGSVNVVGRLESLPFMALEVDEAGARSLASSSSIVSMQEDKVSEIHLDESVPLVGGPQVFNSGFTGQGFTVAVLDTGVEATHSFFGGRVLHEACFSTADDPSRGLTSLCPNGQDSQEGPGAANGCPASLTDCSHGTHVAGIAAGNASGASGVAPSAGIIGLQVFTMFSPQRCGASEECVRSFDFDQIRGMEWVLANRDTYNIAAANLSIGGGQYFDQETCDAENQVFKAAVDALVAANVAVVMSSGNESFTDSLGAGACVSSVIAVGSITKSEEISDFSNSHPMVDILAPGSAILSSFKGNRFDLMGGTSMATPHVAGSFALLRSAKPSASVAEIFAALAQGGVPFEDPRNGLVLPRLQLDTALQILLGRAAPQPTPAPQPAPRPAPVGAPVNDDQNSPTAINSASFRDQIDVRQATMGDDPVIYPTWYCPEGGRYEKSVWYSFTAPTNGYLTVSTQGSNYDTIVSVWQGSRGAPFQIGCSDDDAYPNVLTTTIAGWVAAGTTFRIQVAAWDNGGTLVFNSRFQSSNASSVYTNPNIAPVVFDADLTEVPSDLASSRPAGSPQTTARCEAKGARPAELKGECYTGLAPR